MAWFGRRKKTAEEPEVAVDETAPDDLTAEPAVDPDEELLAGQPVIGTERGPWDIASAPDMEGYLALGALHLPAVEGMMLTFEMDAAQEQVTAVQILQGQSMLQLQAFAAPRSRSIWREIREEIAEGIASQGGRVTEEQGPFGTELVVDLGGNVMRFMGADGPRWFLRGVVNGPAATAPNEVDLMRQVFAHVVVDRGQDAMGPRELLELRLPDAAMAQDASASAPVGPDGRAYDIDPFERGPEITEIN